MIRRYEYRVDGAVYVPVISSPPHTVDFVLRSALAATGGQIAECFRRDLRCGYLDREAFEATFAAHEAERIERASRPRAIPFVEDDGGRDAAGFRGFTGDCVVRAVAIA